MKKEEKTHKLDIKNHLDLFFRDVALLLLKTKKRTWFFVDEKRLEKEVNILIEKYRFIHVETNK